MHHGNDVQQVVLAQLLQPVGQLLHVDGLVAPSLLLRGVLATDTVCVGGAGVLQQSEELGLGVAEGLLWRMVSVGGGLLDKQQRGTYDLVLGIVALRLEVEVVAQCVLAALVCCREDNCHVELAPSLLIDAERRLLERCRGLISVSLWGRAGRAGSVGARRTARDTEVPALVQLKLARSVLTLLVLVKGRVQIVHGLLIDGGQDLVALLVQQPDLNVP